MKQIWLKRVVALTTCAALCWLLYAMMTEHLVRTAAMLDHAPEIIIIDPGHGGEDGGAVSLTGARESNINLEIAKKLDQMFRLCGFQTYLLRKEDISLHKGECKNFSEKKVSDLKNRVALVNAVRPGILISIHQNHFSDSKYSGAQVFYAQTPQSKEFAELAQTALRQGLNPENHRQIKQSQSVYLMENILCPGILVECGFLSHPTEELQLQDPQYQRKIACALVGALSQFVEEREQYGEV